MPTTRVLVHMAIPVSRRSVAKSAAGLSGRDGEYSIKLNTLPGKPAQIWNDVKGYIPGEWYACSHSYEVGFAQTLLADSSDKKTEAFFVAYDADDKLNLVPLMTNLPVGQEPVDRSFDAFVAKLGCVYAD